MTIGWSQQAGPYRLAEKVFETPGLVEFRAGEIDAAGAWLRHVSFVRWRGLPDPMEVLRGLRALADFPVAGCPAILNTGEDDDGGERGVFVVSEWHPAVSLAVLSDARDPAELPDLTLAFYVLRSLCSSVSALHDFTFAGRPFVHGELSAPCVWIDREARVYIHNCFLGLAPRAAVTEQDDVRGLEEIFRRLVGPWIDRGGDLPSEVAAVLGLTMQPGESDSAFFARFVDTAKKAAASHLPIQALARHSLERFTKMFDEDERRLRDEVHRALGEAREITESRVAAQERPLPPAEQAAHPAVLVPPQAIAPPFNPPQRPDSAAERETVTALVADARSALSAGELAKCRELIANTLSRDPKNEEAAQLKLEIDERVRGWFERASGLFQVVRSTPSDVAAWHEAEDLLRNILEVEPEHEDARHKLEQMRSRKPAAARSPTSMPSEPPAAATAPATRRLKTGVAMAALVALVFASAYWLFQRKPAPRGATTTKSVSEMGIPGTEVSFPSSAPEGAVSGSTQPPQSSSGAGQAQTAASAVTGHSMSSQSSAGPVPPPPPPRPPPSKHPATVSFGSNLNVSIYEDGKLLGYAGDKLTFAPGSHILEFRHESLRQQVTYKLASGETISIRVPAFIILVTIQARPWANVFLRAQGGQLKELGLTPLPNVEVPVGGTLVFRHPNFPERTRKVAAGQTAVSVSFQ